LILLRYYTDDGKLVEITVANVEQYIKDKDKEALANFIHGRFYYRYIRPFECPSSKYPRYYKNGFSMMANCCLLIETLETFQQGWENSKNDSKSAFLKFFTRDKNFTEFACDDMPTIFYKNIRCGILHQGETTEGWKITRDGNKNLLDISNKKINATKFMEELEKSINDYKNELKKAEWEDDVWKKAIKKIKAIIESSQ
jgi:hypothetical protein